MWQRQPVLSSGPRACAGKPLRPLTGLGSPAGSCIWHVVGLQRSIREWAMRQGWGGRSINDKQAQGILIAALGVLATHCGYRRQQANRSTCSSERSHL